MTLLQGFRWASWAPYLEMPFTFCMQRRSSTCFTETVDALIQLLLDCPKEELLVHTHTRFKNPCTLKTSFQKVTKCPELWTSSYFVFGIWFYFHSAMQADTCSRVQLHYSLNQVPEAELWSGKTPVQILLFAMNSSDSCMQHPELSASPCNMRSNNTDLHYRVVVWMNERVCMKCCFPFKHS